MKSFQNDLGYPGSETQLFLNALTAGVSAFVQTKETSGGEGNVRNFPKL